LFKEKNMTVHSTTLSSKNQITIPVDFLQRLGWTGGQKFSLFVEGNSLVIKNYEDILAQIHQIVAGYNLPKVSVEEAISQTHQNQQAQKYSYDH
jgi:bifunctional DNA-binding transcriptional regulator/antitoxin component of YhaV-PrlF toxin-antitoxin module